MPLSLNAELLAGCLERALLAAMDEPCYRMNAAGGCPAESLCVAEADGPVVCAGDAGSPFTLMSVMKPFLLLHALETAGPAEVWRRIGQQASLQPYYSVRQLQNDAGRPRNAMLNSGSMVLASLLEGADPADRCERFTDWLRAMTPAPFALDEECLADVLAPGGDPTNWTLACVLQQAGWFSDARPVYETYFRLCCITASTSEVALLAREAFVRRAAEANVEAVWRTLAQAGLYESTPAWMEQTKCPAKSAVSGMMFALVPGRAVITASSPWLDEAGNPLVPQGAIREVLTSVYGVPA